MPPPPSLPPYPLCQVPNLVGASMNASLSQTHTQPTTGFEAVSDYLVGGWRVIWGLYFSFLMWLG